MCEQQKSLNPIWISEMIKRDVSYRTAQYYNKKRKET